MKKISLMNFLRETNSLRVDENVVFAEKAFIINQVMNTISDKEIPEESIVKLLTLVNKYVKNEVNISFNDGKLTVEFNHGKEESEDDLLASSAR
tara:strand:+ start:1429 stop:1710 length:282 start_codon:yes stop_codon:yes gene_type:complete